MNHAKPLCLMLAVLVAFWTPMTCCCALAGEGTATAELADAAPLPSCHGSAEQSPVSTPPDERKPCDADDEQPCQCIAMETDACMADDVSPSATAPSPSHPSPAIALTAVLLPQTMLPHTFATGGDVRAREAGQHRCASLSLVSLSCQLTL